MRVQYNWLNRIVAFCAFVGMALSASFTSFPEELPIAVVVPSYKNSKWCERNLESVFRQNYHNYRLIYIDDASPDGTGGLVRNYIAKNHQEHRSTLIQNTKRVGALANLYKGIWMCAPDEVVATLDGDDWFYDENVLRRLNLAYSNPDVWVTYGQFIYYPSYEVGFGKQLPTEIIASNAFRSIGGHVTSLKSFYAGLFQKIDVDDLLYEGNFYPMAWDLAMMFPILEMAGTHSCFIPDLLYVYNIDNPINDHKKDPALQNTLDAHIRHKRKYLPIERPYD